MPRGSIGHSSKRHSQHSATDPALPKRSRASSSVSAVAAATTTSTPISEVSTTTGTHFSLSANGMATVDIINGWQGKAGAGLRYYSCIGDEMKYFGNEANDMPLDEPHKIDITPSEQSSIDIFPLTVLKSFPILDTITLLIIFLQIPSTILTVVHFLFFLQTFVPPSTTIFGVSSFSWPSSMNMLLQGSNGGPSMLTIMFADCVVASISLFIWPAAWNFLIDFAQAVIAISMAAGNSDGGTLRNVAVCAGVVGGVKVVQSRLQMTDVWDNIRTPQGHGGMHLFTGRIGAAGRVRTILAIHIIAQAAMKATRRWLRHRPDSGDISGAPATNVTDGSAKQKDKDPEAAAGASPPQPTLERENSVGGGKRKKKIEGQSIRINQPMWATMASAIIHIAKEMESTKLSSEASNTNIIGFPKTISNESTQQSKFDNYSIWITKIGSTNISFIAGIFGTNKNDGENEDLPNREVNSTGGTVSNFPFFVRVNGIVWPQTEITPLTSSKDKQLCYNAKNSGSRGGGEEGGWGDEWAIVVTGLTGATEYDFDFVRKGGMAFYSTSACTLPARASTSPITTHSPSGPLSPITTLLHSIAQANSCLVETKANLKSVRKAHRSALSEVRKEIEKHRALIGNDRGEERAFRRNLALRESIKRAEEEAEDLSKKLKGLQHLPDKIKPKWEAKKKQWQIEKQQLLIAQDKAAEEKSKANRRTSAVESEIASLLSKKEKMTTRLTKLSFDIHKLNSENTESEDTKQTREAEREATQKHREVLEQEYLNAINRLETRINDYYTRTHDNQSTFYAFECQQKASTTAAPTIAVVPESNLRQSNSAHDSTPGTTALSLPPGLIIPNLSSCASNLNSMHRERSMSVFSDGSVITNVSEQGHVGFIPAFEPFNNRLGNEVYTPSPVPMAIGVEVGRSRGD